MSVCEEFLHDAQSQTHLVQLYEADENVLSRNVGRFLCDGFKQGGRLLVVATPEHTESFVGEIRRLGINPVAAEREARLVTLDANNVLARIMVDGYPSAERFDSIVAEEVRRGLALADGKGLRVYGELVGVLWKARQFPAAIRLEQLWNKLQKSISFNLFCGYPIDVFDKQFEIGVLDALLCAHTHVVPFGTNGDLESAISRALGDVLGSGIEGVEGPTRNNLRPSWAAMPRPEAAILWVRNNLPDKADEILARAREYYQASA
jgi:hypothetical protein